MERPDELIRPLGRRSGTEEIKYEFIVDKFGMYI